MNSERHDRSKNVTDLQKRTLGRTGLEVTVVGYGAMELRGASARSPRPLPEQ